MGTVKSTPKLSYKEKEELRKLHSEYESINNDKEFTTLEERKQMREEIRNEVKEKFPEVVKFIRDNHIDKNDNIIMYLPELIFSDNQKQFIEDAENEGHKVDYSYSGRCMYGDVCPAVYCESHNDLHTKANTKIDSMGMGIVIYAEK